DVIHGFVHGLDLLNFSLLVPEGVTGFSALHITNNGTNTFITVPGINFEVELTGVQHLTAADFVFNGHPPYGGLGDDVMTGSIIDGGGGNDTITGVDGTPSHLYGGDGNDTITGGNADDVITGDNGNDILHGGDGNDDISGGDGNNTIYGDGGND